MSCWRPLRLFEQPDGAHVPQLLVKPVFHSDSYAIHLTDLSNIWSEELHIDDIVDRALQEQSPIEVSKQDPAQLALLLKNVSRSIETADGTACRLTRSRSGGGVILHASITLPEPLDLLTWSFNLKKCSSATLKNELVLPLLVSSHVQHERIISLSSMLTEKDKAITRLIDQFESSNLDLTAAFPSVGSLKTGRRTIKREQAAKHIVALQLFDEVVWREATAQLQDSTVSTLSLFQEALAQCTPNVPARLKSDDDETTWWANVPEQLGYQKTVTTTKTTLSPMAKLTTPADSSGDETEDEFEIHEHHKTRNLPHRQSEVLESTAASPEHELGHDDTDSTEDDDDLDTQSKTQGRSQKPTAGAQFPRLNSPILDSLSRAKLGPATSTRSISQNCSTIGTVSKVTRKASPLPQSPQSRPTYVAPSTSNNSILLSSQVDSKVNTTARKAREPFRIGGKGRRAHDAEDWRASKLSPKTIRAEETQSPLADPPASSFSLPPVHDTEASAHTEFNEETPEEKVERRRAELKRKNEETIKKQAQHKKKKRF